MVQKTFKVAEVQVSYKPDYKASERPKISSSKQAYDLLMPMGLRENRALRTE